MGHSILLAWISLPVQVLTAITMLDVGDDLPTQNQTMHLARSDSRSLVLSSVV